MDRYVPYIFENSGDTRFFFSENVWIMNLMHYVMGISSAIVVLFGHYIYIYIYIHNLLAIDDGCNDLVT